MGHVLVWRLKFNPESDAEFRFLSWFNIIKKALRNEVISDEELITFFKLDQRADLVKKRANFEGIIKNYYMLGFEPLKLKLRKNEFLFVLKYNFLFSISAFIKFTLKHSVFRRVRRDIEFNKVSKKDLVNVVWGCFAS